MAKLKCPYDDNAKDYVIPTKTWLRAIEQLNPNDISVKGQIITAELINKEKVLVKVTSGKSAKLRDINGASHMSCEPQRFAEKLKDYQI